MLNMCSALPAVFLDRDGVLIEDVDLLVSQDQVHLIRGAAEGVKALRESGFLVVVVSNQTVVARGLATEADVCAVHGHIQRLLLIEGTTAIDRFYYCPHHPNATLPEYRIACTCRKPRPGMLLSAADDLSIDLSASYMIGDRMSDVAAGQRAGCQTILVQSGRHLDPPIESPDPISSSCQPDFVCTDLRQAAEWILSSGV